MRGSAVCWTGRESGTEFSQRKLGRGTAPPLSPAYPHPGMGVEFSRRRLSKWAEVSPHLSPAYPHPLAQQAWGAGQSCPEGG